MKKGRKTKLLEKISYQFDNLMSKGTVALVGMLFLITLLVVLIAGFLGSISSEEHSIGNAIWQSLMHALDAGTLAGNATDNIPFLILMTVVTICGIFVTSILIGIISSGFEDKLNALRKGISHVLESGHTVIIGFDDNIYTILSELIEANSNHKNSCIVILDEREKEEMEAEIRAHISDFKTTKIICRSGKCTNANMLRVVSVENARSVIVNIDNDFQVIKVLLALTSYLKEEDVFDNDMHITAVIHEQENMNAAKIAAEGKAEIIFFKNILSRIIAQVCRQTGLSLVLSDFFGYDGSEFYYENFPQLAGKQFGDVLNLFENSMVVGIGRGAETLLNPTMDTVLEASDNIIHLAEDDGVSEPSEKLPILPDLSEYMSNEERGEEEPYHLLVLGQDEELPTILSQLDEFVVEGSKVIVAACMVDEKLLDDSHLQHIKVESCCCNIYEEAALTRLIENGISNILLLSEGDDKEDADARTMLLLLQLRNIASKLEREFNITSEMNSPENQKLARVAKVNDFVLGSSITNLVVTQISENRELAKLFAELLDAEGSEVYMRPASNYVKLGMEVDFYILTEIVKVRREIVIGCRKYQDGNINIVLNPPKTEKFTFCEEDALIVIAVD
uniref:CASTOR/POLLUX-related putative ion channel n=1 Tax=Acetatifactor sp. TaxID=1872090 RepID=UPI004057597F